MFTRYSTRGGQLAWVSSLCRQQSPEKEAACASPGTTLNNKLSINTPALTPQEAVPSLFSSAHMEKWLCLHPIGPRPWSSQHSCAHANNTHLGLLLLELPLLLRHLCALLMSVLKPLPSVL